MDFKIILNEDNSIETDIYYEPINTHDYSRYSSAHQGHTQKISSLIRQK